MPDKVIKQGDTGDPLRVQLTDNDIAVDLNSAQKVEFRMGGGIVNSEAIIENPDHGVVRYEWKDGDTDISGLFRAHFKVFFRDGKPVTHPTEDYIEVLILEG